MINTNFILITIVMSNTFVNTQSLLLMNPYLLKGMWNTCLFPNQVQSWFIEWSFSVSKMTQWSLTRSMQCLQQRLMNSLSLALLCRLMKVGSISLEETYLNNRKWCFMCSTAAMASTMHKLHWVLLSFYHLPFTKRQI